MKTARLTVERYLERLSSEEPAPGGGSAAAVVAALAAALGAMVCRLTAGRERFRDQEPEITEILAALDRARTSLVERSDEDAAAYEAFHHAFKLPRATPSEKAARKATIATAAAGALGVPLEVARAARDLLPVSRRLLTIGNPNLASDAGVMGLFAAAASRAALLNVKVNLPFLEDRGQAGEIEVEAREIAVAVEEGRAGLLRELEGAEGEGE